MKCAECGRENLDDAKFCSYCACPLVKEPEITDTGSALRKIYNDFGYEKVFEDHRYITSALGDFVPDSEMISNSIEMAYRAGLGKMYEAQIRKGGNPNKAFYSHVKRIITDDAGLSEKRAKQIIGYFDEMLGWENQDIPDSVSDSEPFATTKSVETIHEEEPIRSIPQEQALRKLRPDLVKKTAANEGKTKDTVDNHNDQRRTEGGKSSEKKNALPKAYFDDMIEWGTTENNRIPTTVSANKEQESQEAPSSLPASKSDSTNENSGWFFKYLFILVAVGLFLFFLVMLAIRS